MKYRTTQSLILFLYIIFHGIGGMPAFAQNPILYSLRGLYGYVSEDLRVLIPPKHQRANPFSESGYALVWSDIQLSASLIDRSGRTIKVFPVSGVRDLSHELYSYFDGDREGVIYRRDTDSIIATGLGSIYTVSSESIAVRFYKTNEVGFIDLSGQPIVLNKSWRWPLPFIDGKALLNLEDWSYAFIDRTGHVLATPPIRLHWYRYSEGLIPVQMDDGSTGYMNTSGDMEFLIHFEVKEDYLLATDFVGGLALVEVSANPGRWRIIDRKGRAVAPDVAAQEAYSFSDGISLIGDISGKGYRYIDTKGNLLGSRLFEEAESFENGYARVVYQGRDALMDTRGEIHWCDQFRPAVDPSERLNQ